MKKWLFILLAFLPVLSCVGQKDDPAPELRLVADLTALNVTEGESATFTGFSGAEDVTSFAAISNVTLGEVLEGNVFTPTEAGEWTFVASLDGAESEPVTVTAILIADEGKDYFRRSLVLDFTGTWCVNCPLMEAAIEETMAARPGRIVPVSVHCMAVDPMYQKPFCDDLVSRFGVKAWPSAVVDLDPEILITTSSPELLQSHIDRLLEARGPAAGIRLTTSWEEGTGPHGGRPLLIEAELTAVREGNYTLGFGVLEDGVVASQTGGSADYVHNNVLRHWEIADGYETALKEGETLKLYIIFEATENQRALALAVRNGLVDNVVTCAAGASSDYQYEN